MNINTSTNKSVFINILAFFLYYFYFIFHYVNMQSALDYKV